MAHFTHPVCKSFVIISCDFISRQVGSRNRAVLFLIAVEDDVRDGGDDVAVNHAFTRFRSEIVNAQYFNVPRQSVIIDSLAVVIGMVVVCLGKLYEFLGCNDPEAFSWQIVHVTPCA